MAYGPDATAHQVPVSDGANGWTMKLLTTSELDAAAGILAAQLAGSIPYSKLSLAASVADADIAAGANLHKLAAVSGTANGTKFFRDDGSWQAVPTSAGTKLDSASITATVNVTGTTEGSPTTIVTGNSITYDGSEVKLEFYSPAVNNGTSGQTMMIAFLEDSTVVGRVEVDAFSTAAVIVPVKVEAFRTPAAGAHTYKVVAYVSGTTGTPNVGAGAGGATTFLPAFLRVTKA